ncbi:MAG TPA: TolC family protein [Phycisphaerae bacterium]|nr:TolC family protein [Phycisphaerae bacterium]
MNKACHIGLPEFKEWCIFPQRMVVAEVGAEVRANVVNVNQDAIANRRLGELALQQIASAEEALRLSKANLQAGAMTTLDVLQAQDTLTQARLRYILAVVGYNQAQVNMLASLGLLSEDTVLAKMGGS